MSEKYDFRDFTDFSLKDRVFFIVYCLEYKDEKFRNRVRKHRSFNCLEDIEVEGLYGLLKVYKGSKILKKIEERNSKVILDVDFKLLSKVIEEFSVVF